ncbi:hypothetical protein SAMN06265365_14238 [Tistlia consotensis]|uniref:Uncharacterized protein n=2 Tax=Tistlia TaxID=1321364 RepID=A0A1Y6CQS6_9PROT|nr:hypothetical protein SAMN05428998_14538 [Tistlia consotensis USBA 355]SNS25681.1 hypothetical protein SAMN06265365_14238 [Tistlia consotensis]
MEQTGRYEHARDFLALELDCRRVHAPWPTKLAIAAYQALSDVGRSVARPLGAWAIALFVSFALHLGAFAWPSWPTSSLLTETTKLALASAVVVGSPIFDPLRLERIEHRLAIAAGRCPERSETGSCLLPIPFALQLLELLQAAFSALCLFLAGLGLRNWLRIR